jgi:hypothetical protein
MARACSVTVWPLSLRVSETSTPDALSFDTWLSGELDPLRAFRDLVGLPLQGVHLEPFGTLSDGCGCEDQCNRDRRKRASSANSRRHTKFSPLSAGLGAGRISRTPCYPGHGWAKLQVMADYERETTATTLGGLPDPVRKTMLERADATQLTLSADAPGFLTHSRRLKKPGLFGRLTGTADRDKEHLTALVIGAKDVLVATHGEERGTAVLAARLEDVEVGSQIDRLAAARTGDEGVTITGFPVSVEGVTSRGSFFFGLGPPDGAGAREALEEAVRAAKA